MTTRKQQGIIITSWIDIYIYLFVDVNDKRNNNMIHEMLSILSIKPTYYLALFHIQSLLDTSNLESGTKKNYFGFS